MANRREFGRTIGKHELAVSSTSKLVSRYHWPPRKRVERRKVSYHRDQYRPAITSSGERPEEKTHYRFGMRHGIRRGFPVIEQLVRSAACIFQTKATPA